MATRTISTKLAIQGESEYRASLTRINAQLKTLQSELKLSEAQYKNNANSMQALSAKHETLQRLVDTQSTKIEKLKKAVETARAAEEKWAAVKDEIKEKIKENDEALKALGERTDENAEEYDRLTEENKKLNAELGDSAACMEAAGKSTLNWQTKLNAAQIRLAVLNSDLELTEEYMEEAKNSADNCATSIDRFGNRVTAAAEKSDQLYDALAAAGVIAALKELAEQLKVCIDASVEFESAMAGVKKTTDMSAEELEEMADAIQEMAIRIPATTTEIAGVVEAAGQLGIAKEDLLDFTEVMINLGVATNLSSDEAATSLAKLANITGTPAEAYSRLGSTIVDLGNHFATSEADIVRMATRLAAAGDLAGLTEAQILALSTAMSSVGIEAEAGGTAMTQTLTGIEAAVVNGGEELEKFAEVAGMSATNFALAWNSAPIEAVYAFMAGVGKLEEKGESAALVLEELGLDGIRQSNMIKSLGNASEVLASAIGKASSAWEEDIALTVEANTRYATTESKMQMLSNSANNLKIAIGDELTPALGDFADAGIDVLEWATEFVEEHENLVPVLTATAATVGVLTTATVGYAVATKAAAAISKMFSAAMGTSSLGLVITAVAALTAGIGTLVVTMDDEIESVRELSDAAREMDKTLADADTTAKDSITTTEAAAVVADRYIDRLKELDSVTNKTAEQEKEYHNLLVLLCETVPELANCIDLETDSIWGGTEALDANTEAWRKNAIQQAYQEKLTEVTSKYADVLIEQAKNEIKLTEAKENQRAKTEEQAAVAERMNKLLAEADAKAEEQYKEYGLLTTATDHLTQEYYDLEEEYRALGDEISEFERQENNLTKAIENDTEAVAAAEEEMSSVQEAITGLTGDVEEQTSAIEDNTQAQEDAAATMSVLQTKANELAEAYNSARGEAALALGLFSEFSAKLDEDVDTVDEMTARWKEQAEAVNSYTENVKLAYDYAKKYGLSEDLIGEFTDGSAESAAQLDVIISKIESVISSGGDATTVINELNAAYSGAQQAQSDFADLVAYWQSDFATAVSEMAAVAEGADYTEIKTALETAFAELDIDLAPAWDTFTAAMAEGTGSLEETTKETISSAVEGAVAAAEEAVSENGENIGAGFIESLSGGVADGEESISEAVEAVGESLTEAMTEAALAAVEAFAEKFEEINARTAEVLESLRSDIGENTAALPADMTNTGREMINGMIAGLNERTSSLYARIREIVNASIQAANDAADVHSPSRKTTYIFEMVGEGMIVGAENKREKLKMTMRDIVNDSLMLEIDGKTAVETSLRGLDERLPVISQNVGLSEEVAAALKSSGKREVINYFYPQTMDKAQIEYFIKRINRELGASV